MAVVDIETLRVVALAALTDLPVVVACVLRDSVWEFP